MVGPDAEEETACRIRISNKYNLKPLYLVTLNCVLMAAFNVTK